MTKAQADRIKTLEAETIYLTAERDEAKRIASRTKEELDSVVASGNRLSDQLRQLTESRSVEIRTEALRQARNNNGHIDLSLAYRFEQYLAKGVTLPSETPNLYTAVRAAQNAVSRLTEQLDDSYADSLNSILRALLWASQVDQEAADRREELRRLAKVNSEIGENLQGKITEVNGLMADLDDTRVMNGYLRDEVASLKRALKPEPPFPGEPGTDGASE